MTEDRRYSEEEFALIIRKASELQEAKPGKSGPGGGSGGLSLADIKAIAAEVGLDPDAVQRAAAMVASGPEPGKRTFLGGPAVLILEASVPGEVDESGLGRSLDVVRRELKHQGEAVSVLDSVEWKSEGWANPVSVTLTPRDGKTAVRIIADRSGAAVLSVLFPGIAWLMGTISVLAAAQPSSLLSAGAIVGAGVAGAVFTSRTIWLSASRRIEGKVRRVLSALMGDLDVIAAGEGPDAHALGSGEPDEG